MRLVVNLNWHMPFLTAPNRVWQVILTWHERFLSVLCTCRIEFETCSQSSWTFLFTQVPFNNWWQDQIIKSLQQCWSRQSILVGPNGESCFLESHTHFGLGATIAACGPAKIKQMAFYIKFIANWHFFISFMIPSKILLKGTWNFVWSYEVCADHFVENSWKNEIQCLFYPIGNAEKV